MNFIDQNIIYPMADSYLRVLRYWEVSEEAIADLNEGDECDNNMALAEVFDDFGMPLSDEPGMTEIECNLWNAVFFASEERRA